MWEFPKISGLNIDPNKVEIFLSGRPRNGPPIPGTHPARSCLDHGSSDAVPGLTKACAANLSTEPQRCFALIDKYRDID